MTEPIETSGGSPTPEAAPAPDRMPSEGQSITACRALTAPVTVDRAARTVEVIWSTGARARNFVPSLGLITEELDMAPTLANWQNFSSSRSFCVDPKEQTILRLWALRRSGSPASIG